MAHFPAMSLTRQGNLMLIRSTSNTVSDKLYVTKVIIGDGIVKDSITSLTKLVSPKLEVGLSDEEDNGNGTRIYTFLFDNTSVSGGFFLSEVGVYGRNGESGEERLIWYSNAQSFSSYIPDKSIAYPTQKLTIAVSVGTGANVTYVIDPLSAVTVQMLNKSIKAHNADSDAHSTLFTAIKNSISTAASNSAAALSSHNTDTEAHPPILNMLATILGTGAWNKSATKSIKQIIDLVGEGGIVASRLESTGFIKCANGFLLQWGRLDINKSGEVVFPLPFAKFYQPFAFHLGSTVVPTSANPTNNTRMVVMDTNNVQSATSWFAVGV